MRHAKTTLILAIVLACAAVYGASETPGGEHGLALIRTELRAAGTGLRAMEFVARPAELDAGLLACLRRDLGLETHLCLMTRGDAGEPLGVAERGAALAVRNTRETEALARRLGAEVWYLNLPDEPHAALPKADENALAQWVRVLRFVRPQLLFVHAAESGAQQDAALKLAETAFEKAGDAQFLPEQMKQDGTAPWNVSKLYSWRETPLEGALTLDLSARDPLTGLSAAEWSADGRAPRRYLKLLKARAPQAAGKSPLEGLSPACPPELQAKLEALLPHLQAEAELGSLGRKLSELSAESKTDATVQAHLLAAALEALGVETEVLVSDARVTEDEPVSVRVRLRNGGTLPLQARVANVVPESQHWQVEFGKDAQRVAPGATVEFSAKITPSARAYPTFPPETYASSRMQARSPVNVELAVAPEAAPQAEEIRFRRPVPVDLAPPLECYAASDPALVFDTPLNGDDALVLAKFRVVVVNHRKLAAPLTLYLGIEPREGVPVDQPATLVFTEAHETLSEEFRQLVPVEQLNKGDVNIHLLVWTAEKNFGGPTVHVRRVPMKLPDRLLVGVVRGADGTVLDALHKLQINEPGLVVRELGDADLRGANLNEFHTIILERNVAECRPEVLSVGARLAQFMRDGGNVVCLGARNAGETLAPFALEPSASGVADPHAPAKLLDADSLLLREPCKLWARDFIDWTDGRGANFAKSRAPEFTPLLAFDGPDGKPLDGGLLLAESGHGSYIYSGLSLARQLRAGVPGAYRLLADLISYPRVKRAK